MAKLNIWIIHCIMLNPVNKLVREFNYPNNWEKEFKHLELTRFGLEGYIDGSARQCMLTYIVIIS